MAVSLPGRSLGPSYIPGYSREIFEGASHVTFWRVLACNGETAERRRYGRPQTRSAKVIQKTAGQRIRQSTKRSRDLMDAIGRADAAAPQGLCTRSKRRQLHRQ